MAARTFFCLGNVAHKCIFTSMQCYKPKIQTFQMCRQINSFQKSGRLTRFVKSNSKNVEDGSTQFPSLWKPFIFTVTFSGTAFVVAAICEYERIRAQTYRIFNRYGQFRIPKAGVRNDIHKWWTSLTEGQRVFSFICFLNVLIFLAWRVPAFQQPMQQYFTIYPESSKLYWPLLFAAFSHVSALHLGANMYALYSFSTTAVQLMGREQFVAFYLSSAVVSSFISCLYKSAFRIQRPSIGASGAVIAVFAYISNQLPNLAVHFAFLPQMQTTAYQAFSAFVGLDIIGCIFRWGFLDHAAHLGGALCGVFWHKWGNENLWKKRDSLLKVWNQFRRPPGSD